MKINRIIFLVVSFLFITGVCFAQPCMQFWYPDGSSLQTVETWDVGSNVTPIPKGWFTDLSVSGVFNVGTISGGIDLNGGKLTLDADADTSITADTDDQIDIEIGNADDFQFTANTFSALSGSLMTTDDLDSTTATTLLLGKATATKVEIADSGIETNVQGTLVVDDDLTITGDDLIMTTNTTGAVLVGDGTNFNPVVMSDDATIAASGAISVVDMTCTNCINATEIEDIYTLNSGDVITASTDTSTLLTIQNTDTAIGTAGYLLELIHDSNGDADADFLICQDDGNGTPDTVFSIAHDGSIVVGGTLTSTFTDSVSIGSGTASTVDMGASALADVFISDDLEVDGTIYVADYTRTIPIPATTARVGGTAPTATTIVNTRGLGFDADAEIAFIAVPVPSDWNGTSDMTLITAFCGTSGDAVADTETVKFDISFNSIDSTEAVDNGTEKTATATYTQSGGGTDKALILLQITIDHDNADQPLTAGDALFIKINRDVSTDTYSGAAIVQRWALQYTSNTIPK